MNSDRRRLTQDGNSLLIARAADILRAGGLVAFPTDTFYALGADALNPAAVRRVFDAKGRAEARPLPVLVASREGARRVSRSFPEPARLLARRFWPGALTLVLPKHPGVPDEVTAGGGTVGVRVPDNEVALLLLCAFGGPVTGTSANRSGGPPHKAAGAVKRDLAGRVDLILPGECGLHDAPSTVVDFSQSPPVVVREGAVKFEEIAEVVPGVVRTIRR
jgi:L-threonylcarbamoyladenylate synthase